MRAKTSSWFIDAQTGEITDTAGPRGEGPADLDVVQSIQPVGGNEPRLWLLDLNNGRMVLYDLGALIEGAQDSVRISGSPYQAYWAADSLLTTGMSPTELLQRHVRDGSVV